MDKNKTDDKRRLLVGILTTEGKHSALTGNFKLFRDISLRLSEKGITTTIITPASLQGHKLNSTYIFNKEKNGWVLAENLGLPSVIYNRIPYRSDEKTTQFQTFLTWCERNSIPMFNYSFFSKWDIYSALTKEPHLHSHLPFTQIITSKDQLEKQLNNYSSLYLKPNDGSKGNGIFVLSKLNDGTFQIKGHHGMYDSPFLQNIWERKISTLLLKREYVLQQQIELAKHQERCFDFRILAHCLHKNWVISGIGIRQSKMNGITTHVLKGGNTLKLDEVITPSDNQQLEFLITHCGKQLEKEFGAGCIKEFSMDVGKTNDGEFFIFDINSKPMKFDEVEIYNNGLDNLVQVFLEALSSPFSIDNDYA